jgi:plasmid rolling circle replication initiator protein Rep
MKQDMQFGELGKARDEKLLENIRRWTNHKRRTEKFTTYLKNHFYELGAEANLEEINLRKQIPRVQECGSYLLLRNYYLQNNTRLVGANFCSKHTLCGLCAIRRANKGSKNLHDKAHQVLADNPSLNAYYIVLTVKNEANLAYGMRKLKKGWKRIRTKRKDAKRAKKTKNPEKSKYAGALNSQFANVLAGAYSIEITYNETQENWHPHMNLLVLSETKISNWKLSEEWKRYTGDSYITKCQEVNLEEDTWAFCEIMKYAMKFSELPFKQHKQAYLTLLEERLKGSFGEFYGMDLDPDPSDKILENEPYIEILLSYFNGEYQETRERRAGVETTEKRSKWVPSDLIPN